MGVKGLRKLTHIFLIISFVILDQDVAFLLLVSLGDRKQDVGAFQACFLTFWRDQHTHHFYGVVLP